MLLEQDGSPSVLFCKNIDHWAHDEQWHVSFPDGEDVVVRDFYPFVVLLKT
jgi:hypothetical protein